MKLINYNYGYIPAFSCSIHGKIMMTYDEWREVVKYLKSGAVSRSLIPSHYGARAIFLQDIERQITMPKNSFAVNVRVPMTEKIVARYNLPRYKRANYMLHIIPA